RNAGRILYRIIESRGAECKGKEETTKSTEHAEKRQKVREEWSRVRPAALPLRGSLPTITGEGKRQGLHPSRGPHHAQRVQDTGDPASRRPGVPHPSAAEHVRDGPGGGTAAVLLENPAGKSAANGGRPDGQGGRHWRAGALAGQGHSGQGDRFHAGP